MRSSQLRDRTKAFALVVVRLVEALPCTRSADVIGRQLLRACTSVAANYRSACRARSYKEFIAKLGIVEEEADESQFWIELLADLKLADRGRVSVLANEAGELGAMQIASIQAARQAHTPHAAFPPTPHARRRSATPAADLAHQPPCAGR